MKMPHPIEIVGWAMTVTATGVTVDSLADHGVGVLTMLAVIGSMLSTGMTLTGKFMQAVTTEVYGCAVEGCKVEIRATRNHSAERLAVLKDLAADHHRHGSAGA